MVDRSWSFERVRTLLILLVAVATIAIAYVAIRSRPPAAPPPPTVQTAPGVALVVVFAGQELWVGNTEHETDRAFQYAGALGSLRAAFAAYPPARALPAGSLGAVIGYSTGLEVRLPLGPLERLDENTFGVERDYRGRIGSDLVAGIDRGIAELAKEGTPARRVLLIIGDGNNTSNDELVARMPLLLRDVERHHIEVHAIVLPSELSPEGHQLGGLTSQVQVLTQRDELPAALARVWREVMAI